MKKTILICLSLLLAFAFVSCERERTLEDIMKKEAKIEGVVTEVYPAHILIEAFAHDDGVGAGIFHVSRNAKHKDSAKEIAVGDTVAVYYTGAIAETYPPQITSVYAIVLLTPAHSS